MDILCTCVSIAELSLIRLGQMNPRNFVLSTVVKGQLFLSPPTPFLKALTPATSKPSEIHYSTCSIAAYAFIRHQFYPPSVFFQRTITSSSWIDSFVNSFANSKDSKKKIESIG